MFVLTENGYNEKISLLVFNCTLFLQFLSQDLPLFEGIVSDLFPGITLPSPDHGVLEEALRRNSVKMGLQAVPWFVEKVVQVCSQLKG